MARLPFFIFLLGAVSTSVGLAVSQKELGMNRNLDFCFSSRRNESGHFVNKWSVNDGATDLPDNYKINMKSNVREEGGMKFYRFDVEIAVPPPRPPSYEFFPGIGFYKFYPYGVMTYNEAASTCMSEGGHLAIINSAEEMEVLKLLYARHPDASEPWAWVGFNDIAEEGNYVTVFGQPLEATGYTEWFQGMPDGGRDENCGSVYQDGGLNDLLCDTKGPWPFFCEYDLSWDS